MLNPKIAAAARLLEQRAQVLLRDQSERARDALDEAVEEYIYQRGQEAWEQQRAEQRKAGGDA